MQDNKDTNPENLRSQYMRPKNPLQNVEEPDALQTALAVAIAPTTTPTRQAVSLFTGQHGKHKVPELIDDDGGVDLILP